MTTLRSTLCSTALAFCVAASGVIPANAGALQMPRTEVQANQVQLIHDSRRGFSRRGGRAYYNGHRGYRQKRRGYRHYRDYWFPPAAFLGGVIIGGAIARNRGPYYDRDPYYDRRPYYRRDIRAMHIQWCYSRYRSYRAYDDTFQPYHGYRRRCWSPYVR